ncbi:MAG: hypothetical protein LBF40_05875 [Deltaproteobacteria bacterium]|nr:hypothetical protein [Deltaproteobacteria bacterium]
MKIWNLRAIAFVLALTAFSLTSSVFAQGNFGYITVWSSGSFQTGDDTIVYEFTASGLNLSVEVQDLTIKTFEGDLVFNGTLSNKADNQIKKCFIGSKNIMYGMLIADATGTINGKKQNVNSMIRIKRQVTPIIATDPENMNLEIATVEYFELDRFLEDGPIFFGDAYLDTPVIGISTLLTSAQQVYSNFSNTSKIYNNDVFYPYVNEDGVYLLLITNGLTEGFKIVNIKAYEDKDKAEVLFGFTCTIEPSEIHGPVCTNPKITENGKDVPIATAMKSNNVILRALKEAAGGTTWRNAF